MAGAPQTRSEHFEAAVGALVGGADTVPSIFNAGHCVGDRDAAEAHLGKLVDAWHGVVSGTAGTGVERSFVEEFVCRQTLGL